jgi:hypothetical protein
MMDREKFKTLVHYICWKCDDPSKLGATKLNKIIWFAERSWFLKTGEAISGVKFVKQERGPVPNAILPVLDSLVEEHRLVIREGRSYSYPRREFISLIEPEFEIFSAKQVSLIDDVIQAVCHKYTANSISDLTHDEIWDLAEIGEEIPLYTTLAKHGELQAEDIEWANSFRKH